ncbi:NAD(P)/FAD-dependent oxidoreductase [Paracoccus sp. IB05]|uniref:FAD-dependent oxidoreductase n=1 Tax=Paracoccus sp. IB05 TaxID=2779367 RepID=UPI0018E72A70|nr:NAD(P)/FAD-dependent oxidoreductase [Paracoccus sp. IB05]MBJ2151594.1 FAD-dependent monooxygenase [Paracoccus sp. IB05]
MTSQLTALVAGGGFGGLTAATALAQRGWQVTLCERMPELRASGSGIYIWENGLRILDALGAQALDARAFRGFAMEQRNAANEVIDDGAFPPHIRLYTIARSGLMNALRDAALRAGVKIRTGCEVLSATASGEVQFPGGDGASADLVVGADGIWSGVRRSLGLEASHELTPEGALRAIIPGTQADLGPGGARKYLECWNGERRFLITPINESEIYLALTCQAGDESGKQVPLDRASWSASFPHWAHLIDRITETLAWSPYSIVKVKSWSSGRAAIIGDAAHAQPPNLGQGGGMAMQSALALAVHLEGVSDRRDIPDALARWEAAERPLAEHCQKWSCIYGEVSTLPDEVRDRVVAAGMADTWLRSQFLRVAMSVPTGT